MAFTSMEPPLDGEPVAIVTWGGTEATESSTVCFCPPMASAQFSDAPPTATVVDHMLWHWC
ncbi:MAG: hypothetical protein ACH34U_10180 [Cyanobium sp.]